MENENDYIFTYFSHQLSNSINLFLFGDIEESKQFLLTADADLESLVGKTAAQELLESIDPLLIHWKNSIISSNFNKEQCASECPPIVLNHDLEIEADNQTSESDFEVNSPEKDEAISRILNFYDNDKLHEAIKIFNEIKDTYHINLNNHPKLYVLQKEYEEIMEGLHYFDDTEGWITESSTEDIKISYKQVPNTPTISMLSEAELDVGLFNIVTMFYELDLYPEWLPFCKKSMCVRKLSRSRIIAMQEFGVQGLAARQTFVYGIGADLLKSHGAVLVVSKSCDESKFFKGVELPLDESIGRAKINYCGFKLMPINRNKTVVKLISNFDPCLQVIPYAILNWFTRKYARGFFGKIAKLAKNFEGSPWEERLTGPENGEFYRYTARSLDEYFQSIGI